MNDVKKHYRLQRYKKYFILPKMQAVEVKKTNNHIHQNKITLLKEYRTSTEGLC